jgi:hypothetical protein
METITDDTRRSFLDALDDSDCITPTQWEIDFLSSTMDLKTFSVKQRGVIDWMISNYGDILNF